MNDSVEFMKYCISEHLRIANVISNALNTKVIVFTKDLPTDLVCKVVGVYNYKQSTSSGKVFVLSATEQHIFNREGNTTSPVFDAYQISAPSAKLTLHENYIELITTT